MPSHTQLDTYIHIQEPQGWRLKSEIPEKQRDAKAVSATSGRI